MALRCASNPFVVAKAPRRVAMAGPAVGRAELERLRDEWFCDDVLLPAGSEGWRTSEAIAFFSSGGLQLPAPPAPLGADAAGDTSMPSVAVAVEKEGSPRPPLMVSIGGVSLAVQRPAAPALVPQPAVGLLEGCPSQASLSALRWMMVQLSLSQDMLLLADPGPRPRQLIMGLCAFLGRECE